jgi:hypothetical protein
MQEASELWAACKANCTARCRAIREAQDVHCQMSRVCVNIDQHYDLLLLPWKLMMHNMQHDNKQ